MRDTCDHRKERIQRRTIFYGDKVLRKKACVVMVCPTCGAYLTESECQAILRADIRDNMNALSEWGTSENSDQ